MNIFVKSVKFKFNLLKNSEVRAKQNRLLTNISKTNFFVYFAKFQKIKKKKKTNQSLKKTTLLVDTSVITATLSP